MQKIHLRRLVSFLMAAFACVAFALPAIAIELPTPPEEAKVAQAGGILKVYSNIKGARVFLNDEEIGKTPTIRLLPPGRYKVRLVMQGYETYEEQIEILANKAVTINAPLTKVVGSIEVVANVDGATVFLDDKEAGKTPNVVLEDLPSGTYQIAVKKPGYTPYSGPITVKANVRLKLRVELTPSAAFVNIASNPAGAKVFLDNQEVGVTPLNLDSIEAGRHALKFELPGHGTYFRTFQVSIGEKLDIKADLAQEVGGLRVKTKTPGAEVYVEGTRVGTTPLEIEDRLRPGQYSLRVSRSGYADHIQPVVIEKNRTTKVSIELISLDEARKSGAAVASRSDVSKPLTKKWWFWTVLGGTAAAIAGGTTAALLSGEPPPPGDIQVGLP